MAKRAKQQDLPIVSDKKLDDLHKAAERYVDVRDERMELTKQEVVLSAELLGLMKKHKKEKYVCDGLEIRVAAEEKVKVRLKKEKEDE